jgi:hypothetical protein
MCPDYRVICTCFSLNVNIPSTNYLTQWSQNFRFFGWYRLPWVTFPLRIKNCPKKPGNFSLLSFEPGPSPIILCATTPSPRTKPRLMKTYTSLSLWNSEINSPSLHLDTNVLCIHILFFFFSFSQPVSPQTAPEVTTSTSELFDSWN